MYSLGPEKNYYGILRTNELTVINNIIQWSYSLQMGYYKCDGTNFNLCTHTSPLVYSYSNLGPRVGSCNVQCLTDACYNDGTKNFYKCQNNIKVNQGEVAGQCGATCLEDQVIVQGTEYYICKNEVFLKITDLVILTQEQQQKLNIPPCGNEDSPAEEKK